jgi:hypothetical protein
MHEQPIVDTEQGKRFQELKERGIVSFDVHLTKQERDALDQIRVMEAVGDFDYYGSSATDLERSLIAHLNQIGTHDPESIAVTAHLMARVAEDIKTMTRKPAAWVTVRIFLPTDAFDEPRWHEDGHYTGTDEEEYKLVFSPKGAPTRFKDLQVPEGHAVIYKVGVKGVNTHSEPEIKAPRIFMSAVPGSEEQIAELHGRLKP